MQVFYKNPRLHNCRIAQLFLSFQPIIYNIILYYYNDHYFRYIKTHFYAILQFYNSLSICLPSAVFCSSRYSAGDSFGVFGLKIYFLHFFYIFLQKNLEKVECLTYLCIEFENPITDINCQLSTINYYGTSPLYQRPRNSLHFRPTRKLHLLHSQRQTIRPPNQPQL